MANSREFPVARSDSSMVVRNGELMVWGGYTQTIYGEGEGSFIVPINLPGQLLASSFCQPRASLDSWHSVIRSGCKIVHGFSK